MSKRGKYIVFEGGDCSGKTTLIAELVCDLPAPLKARRFPSDGDVGTVIREALMGKRSIEKKAFLYLFAADGLQEEVAIERELAEGYTVLCDRHPTMSGEVFQLEHHDWGEISAVYTAARRDGLRLPDALFVIDVPAEVALERMRARDKYRDVVFERDDLKYVCSLRERYRSLAQRHGGHVLDGTKPTAELVKDVRRLADL